MGRAAVALVPDNRIIYGINQWIDEHKPDPELGYADSESEALYAFIIDLAALAPSQPAAVAVTDEMVQAAWRALQLEGRVLSDRLLRLALAAALRSTP